MELEVGVKVPYLFGGNEFRRTQWGPMNLLVGPNATGKTKVFDAIMAQARAKFPHAVRVLGTSRLTSIDYKKTSLERIVGDLSPRVFGDQRIEQVYSSTIEESHEAFLLIEKRKDIRIRILALLEQMFGKNYELAYERGILKVFGSTAGSSSRYDVLEECHGLKELVTLLAYIYCDQYKVMGIDEPELHLHPQLQYFLMQEIRNVAGDPETEENRKAFFIVTHSPTIVTIRSLADLATILLFNSQEALPSHLDLQSLSDDEKEKLTNLIPHLNTHRREFLFAKKPVFTEGPFDATFLEMLAEKLSIPYGASGQSVTPMGGKDQFALYYRLCKIYAKDFVAILDLDCLVEGQIINCVKKDPAIEAKLAEAGHSGRDLQELLGELHASLTELGKVWVSRYREKQEDDFLGGFPELELLLKRKAAEDSDDMKDLWFVLLGSIQRYGHDLEKHSPSEKSKIKTISSNASFIIDVLEQAHVYVHRRGGLESHFKEKELPLRPSDYAKRRAYACEIAKLSSLDSSQIELTYPELMSLLDKVLTRTRIDFRRSILVECGDVIHEIQKGFRHRNLRSLEQITSDRVMSDRGCWDIFKLCSFQVDSDGTDFTGELRTLPEFGGESFTFSMKTVPTK